MKTKKSLSIIITVSRAYHIKRVYLYHHKDLMDPPGFQIQMRWGRVWTLRNFYKEHFLDNGSSFEALLKNSILSFHFLFSKLSLRPLPIFFEKSLRPPVCRWTRAG